MEKILAKDKECCNCGKQADVFWPIIDPDIKSHAYCNKCVKEEQFKLMLAMDYSPVKTEDIELEPSKGEVVETLTNLRFVFSDCIDELHNLMGEDTAFIRECIRLEQDTIKFLLKFKK